MEFFVGFCRERLFNDEMQPMSDAQLLRQYAERGDESSFAELVARHAGLVYSAALRQVDSPDLARDITQNVFTDLARKARSVAGKLSEHSSLVGWLYRGTRFEALNLRRDTQRRQSRERQAMEQLLPNPDAPPEWDRLRPLLDEAMADLGDADRDAVLLRYFKNHSLREVGLALGVSDDAAQKRVSRAVERLREFFARRGVTVGAGGLVIVISANAVQSAPVGLAVAISTAAVLAGTAVQTSTAIAATKVIAMTTLHKSLIGAALAVAVGTGIYETRKASRLRDKLRTLEQQQAEQNAQFQRERGAAFTQLAALGEDYERSKSNSSEMLKLRSEVARLGANQQEQANFRWSIARPDAAPTPTSTQPNEGELPKDSWADVGFATPQSALRTRGWAVLNGNRERFKESVFITDGARKLMEDMLEKMIASAPEAEKKRFSQQILNDNLGFEEALLLPMMAENQAKGYTGYRILSQQAPSADEMILEVATGMASAPQKKETMKFRRFGSDWKVLIDEGFIKANH